MPEDEVDRPKAEGAPPDDATSRSLDEADFATNVRLAVPSDVDEPTTVHPATDPEVVQDSGSTLDSGDLTAAAPAAETPPAGTDQDGPAAREPQLDAEAEPVGESQPEGEAETADGVPGEDRAQSDRETQPDGETEPPPIPESDGDAVTPALPVDEDRTEPVGDPSPEQEQEPDSPLDSDLDAVPPAESETGSDVELQPEAGPDVAPESDVEPAAEGGSGADPVIEEDQAPIPEPTPEPELTEEEATQVAGLGVDEPAEDSTPPHRAGPGGHRLTISDWLRPDLSQTVIAIVLAAFSFAVVTQIHTRDQVDSYSSLRQSDLVGMIDGLNQESQRLQGELESLRQAQAELESGQDNAALARAQAEQRLTSLGILAGTLAAQGPGITLTISDPAGNIKPGTLLDAVEEMRDAGAEAIEVNGTVRIVASSWFSTGPSGVIIDGRAVSTPITMEVIGDPHSLEEAARFRGGLVSQITDPRVGGHVTITRSDNLVVSSLHQPQAPRYARPQEGSAPAPSTPGN